MHDVNIQVEKSRKETERKMETERDRRSLEARIKLQDEQTLRNKHDKLK